MKQQMHENSYIEISKLQKQYKDKKLLLDDVNIRVNKGEFIGIIGDNGVGKTTLLQILGLCDLSHDSADFYRIGDAIILSKEKKECNLTAHELSKKREDLFGFVFQEPRLIPFLDCRHNLKLPLILRNKSTEYRKKRISEVLYLTKFPESLLDERIQTLSGGEKQLLSIARALISDPKILLADEAISNLSPDNRKNILNLFKTLSQNHGITIIMTSHFQKELIPVADRLFSIADGKLYDVSNSFTGDISGTNLTESKNYYDENILKKTTGNKKDVNECPMNNIEKSTPGNLDTSETDKAQIKTKISDIWRLGYKIFNKNLSNMITLSIMLLGFSLVLTICFGYAGSVNNKINSMQNSFKRIMILTDKELNPSALMLKDAKDKDGKDIEIEIEKVFVGLNYQILFKPINHKDNHEEYIGLQARSLMEGDYLYEDMDTKKFSDRRGLEAIFTHAGLKSLGFYADPNSYIGKTVTACIIRSKDKYSDEIEKLLIPLKVIDVIDEGIAEGQLGDNMIGLYIPDGTLQFFRAWEYGKITQLIHNDSIIKNNFEQIIKKYNRFHVYPKNRNDIEAVRDAIHSSLHCNTDTKEEEYKKIRAIQNLIDIALWALNILSLVVIPLIIALQTGSFIINKRAEITTMKIMGGKNTYIALLYSINVLIAELAVPFGIGIGFLLSILLNKMKEFELSISYNDVLIPFIISIFIICIFMPVFISFCAALFAVRKRNLIDAFQR